MRRNRFQNKVATSGFTLPVAAFLATLLWCAEGIYTLDRLWGWAICGLTAYFWVETNNAHALIRIRTQLTAALYLWMAGCIFSLHPLQDGSIVSCFVLASYYLLFKSYQRTEAVNPIFHSFLCIGIGSLFFPQLLYFVPFYLWYTAIYLRSLTWRTFWAAVTGLVLPYWFALGYHLYKGEAGWFAVHFRELVRFQPISPENYQDFGYLQISTVGLIALFTLVAALHDIRTSFNDKIRTRMFLYLLLTQELLITLFMALQPMHFQLLLGLWVMNSAPILSHYFALTSSRFARAVFILYLSLFAVLSVLSLWMPW